MRYGPAVIFSNEVPGLDVNFIDPKYTKDKPYNVTETPGYIVNTEFTNQLDNKNPKDFNSLIDNIMSIAGNKASKDSISIKIIVDYDVHNECQMAVFYDNNCILVETGSNSITDDLYKEMTGLDAGDFGGNYYMEEYSYSEFTTKFGTSNNTINKLIKEKEFIWTGTNLSRKVVSYQADYSTSLSSLNYIARENGYPGTLKDYSSSTCTVTWSKDEVQYSLVYSGKKVDYETKYKYTLSATTPQDTKTPIGTKVSTSAELQKTISTWYKALRAIALVGLLSVLVYVGIRILISSTGQEKAKYKKMIGDWLAAICILFILQYLMIFILEITQKITDILKANALGPNGEDLLMSKLRTDLGIQENFAEIFFELLMYLVLVIYTVMFTIQYLKRLIYMAFFTMIAPLIALTYPLDKIKDGQAQAFSTWLREYIFNALLQPMHLLLYSIFVGSAMDLVNSNPLYGIVLIGFLLPAEKFFRKMFGFDKAESSSQLGAAAGGALIMNAINKMGAKAGSAAATSGTGGSGGSGGSSGGVRTSNNGANALDALNGGDGANPAAGGDGANPMSGGGGANPMSAGGGANPMSAGGGANPMSAGGGTNPSLRQRLSNKWQNAPKPIKGVANLAKNQLFTRKAGHRNLRGIGKLVGGAAGLTVGMAAGIASGNLSNALSYGLAGAAGGASAGGGLVDSGFGAYDKAVAGVDSAMYQYQEGANGEEYAQNEQFNRAFRRSDDYKSMAKKYGSDIGAKGGAIDQIVAAGITDTGRMEAILKNRNKAQTVQHAIAYNQLANDCNDSILYDDKKLRMFLDKRGIKGDINALRQRLIDFK